MDSILITHGIDILSALIQTILVGLITYGFTIVISKVKSEKLKDALGILQGAVNTTVGELNNNFVKEWKLSGNGKLSTEQIEKLKKDSIDLVYSKLTDPTVKLLDASYNDLNEIIQSYIDARLDELKSNKTSVIPEIINSYLMA